MLRLHDVHAGHGDIEVLHGVSLDIPSGSVTAVLGPNGAGKTTLLDAAAGVLPLRAGTVELDGRDLRAVPVHRRAALGICHVTEGRNVFPNLTVAENLRLFAPARRERDVQATALGAFPALRDRLHHRAGTLSGGERQMLALARAACTTPRVLLLDEVSMGLAPRIADEVFAWIVGAADAGAAVLVVEQHVERVLAAASRISVLRDGRIVHAGTAADLAADDLLARYAGVTH